MHGGVAGDAQIVTQMTMLLAIHLGHFDVRVATRHYLKQNKQ
jgi:hypothetical protein